MRFTEATPTYLGSKRKLLREIFTAAESAGAKRGQTFLDCFAGASNVGLMAKALGYRVVANDVSARSEAVGKALIENDTLTLHDYEVALAIEYEANGWYRPPIKQLPWPEAAREVLVSITAAAEQFEGTQRHLLRCLAVKTASLISFWGQPRMTVGHRIREERWDDLTTGQAKALDKMTKPKRNALRAAAMINRGVFSNGLRNEMHCGDVLDFLADRPADVAYFDPPYPGVTSYEKDYVGLDAILLNYEIIPESSRFSASDGWKFLDDVFAAAAHIPLWVVSLGNVGVTLEEVEELIRGHGREVDAQALHYAHLQAKATKEKTEGNLEYLITARA